jgi:hypothetical protein
MASCYTAAGPPVGLQLVGPRRSYWHLLAAAGAGQAVPALA